MVLGSLGSRTPFALRSSNFVPDAVHDRASRAVGATKSFIADCSLSEARECIHTEPYEKHGPPNACSTWVRFSAASPKRSDSIVCPPPGRTLAMLDAFQAACRSTFAVRLVAGAKLPVRAHPVPASADAVVQRSTAAEAVLPCTSNTTCRSPVVRQGILEWPLFHRPGTWLSSTARNEVPAAFSRRD